MTGPLVSVIIPTYGGAEVLGHAIQSVLDQSYQNFEIVVVDDHSPDNTAEVMAQFNDSKIKYIRHEQNQGAASARGTGRRNASGEIFAFLDQDDLFHTEKLAAHVEMLEKHPEVGFTFNPYFELVPASKHIRTVFQPPKDVNLAHLSLGFYLPPSSWVVRREWAFQEEIWDANASLRGREIMVCGRLFMSGCKFARIEQVLHSRSYHPGRRVKNLEDCCRDEVQCQEIIFDDPRCPPEIKNLRHLGNAHIHMMWANVAFAQSEPEVGRNFLWKINELNPDFFAGIPSMYVRYLMGYCVDDESQEFEALFDRIIAQLPAQIPNLLANYLWARPRGNLIRGVRALVWDRPEDGDRYFARADLSNFEMDEDFIGQATHEILGYELYHGEAAVPGLLSRLSKYFEKIGKKSWGGWIKGSYLIQKAEGQEKAHKTLLEALASHPKYLLNRGIVRKYIKSLIGPRASAEAVAG